MITKNQIKFVTSLRYKKYRESHRCFVAEGSRMVNDLISSKFRIRQIYATDKWIYSSISDLSVVEVSNADMNRISSLTTATPVLAVVEMPSMASGPDLNPKGLTLVLDNISDPGNLGTIIRIADWFGINELICSGNTTDLYNPKVVQATMGSLARIRVFYTNLVNFFGKINSEIPVYGMMIEGKRLYDEQLPEKGCIIIGNEAHGISEPVANCVTHKLSIPHYPEARMEHAESLNAAIATGIVVAEFRRKR